MYAAGVDPYCYVGTTVLKNVPGLRDQDALDRFEAIATAKRAEEPLPAGRLDVRHYRAIHRHLFQDVFRWAGRFRTVRIGKADSMFCYPENIAAQMDSLFAELKARHILQRPGSDEFALEAARFLSTLKRDPSLSRRQRPYATGLRGPARAAGGPSARTGAARSKSLLDRHDRKLPGRRAPVGRSASRVGAALRGVAAAGESAARQECGTNRSQ